MCGAAGPFRPPGTAACFPLFYGRQHRLARTLGILWITLRTPRRTPLPTATRIVGESLLLPTARSSTVRWWRGARTARERATAVHTRRRCPGSGYTRRWTRGAPEALRSHPWNLI